MIVWIFFKYLLGKKVISQKCSLNKFPSSEYNPVLIAIGNKNDSLNYLYKYQLHTYRVDWFNNLCKQFWHLDY